MVKMEEIATSLEGVSDVDTAKIAAKKIEKIAVEVVRISKAMDEVKGSDEEVAKFEKEMEERYKERVKKMTEKVTKSMMALVAKPEAMKIIGDTMTKMSKTMADK